MSLSRQILARFRASDARDAAYLLGFEVCSHKGPTRVRGLVLFYNQAHRDDEKDIHILAALDKYILRENRSLAGPVVKHSDVITAARRRRAAAKMQREMRQ